jgi:hypothetical protein
MLILSDVLTETTETSKQSLSPFKFFACEDIKRAESSSGDIYRKSEASINSTRIADKKKKKEEEEDRNQLISSSVTLIYFSP